jgi:drug/metabolite transporter (DMT)-like permease
VDPLVFGLVAASAILHVSWNVIVKTSGDPLRSATVAMAVGACALAPLAFAGWLLIGRPAIPAEVIGLALVSGTIEAVYVGLLATAYRHGDLSIVYPLARGSAVLLAVAIGTLVLGERLGAVGQVGVAALVAGFLWLQRPWAVLGRAARNRSLDLGIAFALLAGIAIASYSAIDRVGTQLAEPWLYGAILWSASSILLVGWVLARDRTSERLPRDRRTLGGGVIMVTQYLLVLTALSLAPLSAVAPLRESAAVLATGWGAFRLGEAAHRREAVWRVAAAGLIVVGAVLLAIDG